MRSVLDWAGDVLGSANYPTQAKTKTRLEWATQSVAASGEPDLD
jgi:hypothetical protein